MAIGPGFRFGPYEVNALIGEGGMGKVWRAHHTGLKRDDALKVLPDAFASDPDRVARFQREAQVLASLNHPNIAHVYGLEHANGVQALVMELVEGPTLADRIAQGAIPIDEALPLAKQIAEALEAAHERGIIHRDLKPANIKVRPDGTVKVLDFGLAKAMEAPGTMSPGVSQAPTITTPAMMTGVGMILGTAAYMSPEQARGKVVDKRTDIWAFGAVLFEMLTGTRAFPGDDVSDVLASVLAREPDWAQLPPIIPPELGSYVKRCLHKNPKQRIADVQDVRLALEGAFAIEDHGASASALMTATRRRRRMAVVAAAAFGAGAVMAVALWTMAVGVRSTRGAATALAPVQFAIAPPENATFGGPPAGGTGSATQVALSPDGRTIVFVAGTQSVYRIWQRQVAALDAIPIPGTEGGAFPFWSPDSQSVGFFADGQLKKIQVSGGPPTILSDAPAGRGGSWSRDDVIVFATAPRGDVGLVRVSSGGGEATAVTKLDPTTGETSHRWPHFLPDGRHFLYTASTGTCCPAPRPGRVRIGSLDVGEAVVTLFEAESSVSYSAGYLLFARDSTLLAQPFDADTRRTTGDAFPIAAGISWEGSRYVGAAVSQTGTLVYSQDNSQVAQPLTWFDRQGRVLGTLGPAVPYVDLAIAPQERRLAVAVGGAIGANRDVWLIDIARNVPSRQTFDAGTDGSPVWSPDGSSVVFGRLSSGTDNGSLRQKLINTSDADTLLLDGKGVMLSPTDWSRDGRFIAYTVTRGFPPALDIWVLPLFGDRKPFPLAQTEFLESSAVFSPDGQWVAYSTDEGGQSNVYVQPFLRAGGKYPISTEGGIAPTWRADGKELFYLAPDGTLMATAVDAVGEFAAGVPTPLFQTRAMAGFTTFGYGTVTRFYDATRDGQRFIVNARAASVAPLTVVLNWTATINRPGSTPSPAK